MRKRITQHLLLYQDILRYRLPVQHTYDPMTIPGIMLRVCYHYNRCALFIQSVSNCITSLPLCESRLPVGSSASISFGLFTTALATATRCC